MLALERHIATPLRRADTDDAAGFGEAQTVIAEVKRLADAHVTELERLLERLGSGAARPIESAWSTLLGVGTAAIDGIRKTPLSTSFRDDYTALCLVSIRYTMLYGAAVGIGDTATADLAQRHLADYVHPGMHIARAMPLIVLHELEADGAAIATGAADIIRRHTGEVVDFPG